MGTELTTTGVAALETELKAYRDCRSQTRKHLDSMGFPHITGTCTANLIVNTQLWYATKKAPRTRSRPSCP